jgi:hypothetical protein
MEACFKAARIAVEQGCSLQASAFLQNVIFINLTLSELEKVNSELILWDKVFPENVIIQLFKRILLYIRNIYHSHHKSLPLDPLLIDIKISNSLT